VEAVVIEGLTGVCNPPFRKRDGRPCFPVAAKEELLVGATHLQVCFSAKEHRTSTEYGVANNEVLTDFFNSLDPKILCPLWRAQVREMNIRKPADLAICRDPP
jgi:hypothetical protein